MIPQEILEAEAQVDRTAADLIETQEKGFDLLASPPMRAADAQRAKERIAEAQHHFRDALDNLKAVYRKAM